MVVLFNALVCELVMIQIYKKKVRDVLMNVGLAVDGKRPVVAIDECQVL